MPLASMLYRINAFSNDLINPIAPWLLSASRSVVLLREVTGARFGPIFSASCSLRRWELSVAASSAVPPRSSIVTCQRQYRIFRSGGYSQSMILSLALPRASSRPYDLSKTPSADATKLVEAWSRPQLGVEHRLMQFTGYTLILTSRRGFATWMHCGELAYNW
jgi:hypothetical protein